MDAEIQRSYAVAEMKKAHKLIEDTEKLRKRPIIQSICQRIDFHNIMLGDCVIAFGQSPLAEHKIVSDIILDDIRNHIQTYESIRFDFQKNLKLKDDEMNKLFPKIIANITTGYSAVAVFMEMAEQLKHMRLYCERLLV